ncbi:probable serine/threonine-protein kinase DDB_G0282963 [Oppia nitens]|uniref:probable serine/threonine-protein kinase DDB_G0282963 n=1 Tax=Oppia nitens TaxID=1686743 RepID=UPI0023DAE81E|nr:probable serine/threonine-protein kinase DDB_G0282963 [Oppia nitens]
MLSNVTNNSNDFELDRQVVVDKDMATDGNITRDQLNGMSDESQTDTKTISHHNHNQTLKDCIQQTVSEKTKKRITAIINEIEEFNDIEKLLLYIQLPNGSAQDVDPLKQKGPGNPFGKKADVEVAQTYTWIQSHLEEDSTVSLPKQEVYEEYKVFCEANKFEPLCVADFGKAMKHVFPKVKPRRLGQRGNSKYCYSGLRKKLNIEPPELPVLDTSGYESTKSNKNWESDKNSISDDESFIGNDVIISWATKVLNRNFDSLPDLTQYLITSKSFDFSLSDNFKSNDNKNYLKTNAKTANGSRRPIQNHLQRKLQEKEQERKRRATDVKCCSEVTKTIQTLSTKASRKSRKNSTSKSETSESMTTTSLSLQIKKEPEFELSPNLQTNRPQNKVAIPRTVTPSRMTQPISTSIILVPTATVRLASPQSTLSSDCTATTTMSTITSSSAKQTTPKYKRIQPKPVNICRSDSESAVSTNRLNETNEAFNIFAKRRHSVSVPINKDIKVKQTVESFGEKQIQAKRQIEEKEAIVNSTKKRHIDTINTLNTFVSNSTNSSGFDDANSNNSLSPDSSQYQTITNGTEIVASDIRINDIESEALMDYFNNSAFSVTNSGKEQWETNTNGNQTAKLSQLRQLLENHLPNNTSNKTPQRVGETAPLECYSELREALLRKNLNNSFQNYSGFKTMDSNEQSNGLVSTKDIECQISQQLDTSLIDINSLSSLSITSKNSNFTNGEYFNQYNDNKNGLYNNVNIQVPSVPPSPNARRRAFNFQPISPRDTPTIPENSTIDSISYNGFNFTNNINSASPQYRLNQHTVGVGPSQPSSEVNSPFVSPRSTPVTPVASITPLPPNRSRHNSGQSSYSALQRQTPLQTQVDSGVSSISSSPFISPQTTPLPTNRVRAQTGGIPRNMNRARHSSGPGGPISLCSGIHSGLIYNRSNSLSPMIGDNFVNGNYGSSKLPFTETRSSQMVSLASNMNTNIKSGTPLSPLSPMTVIQQQDFNSLTSDQLNGNSHMTYDWSSNHLKSTINDNSIVNRQRHASNPYKKSSVTSSSDHYSPEIISHMKNSVNITQSEANKTYGLLNRCQSVPAANLGLVGKNGSHLSSANSVVDISSQLLDESTAISKSYPATPVCPQPFQFPPSPPPSTKQQIVFGGNDLISGNVLQSGQDLMVSGVQLRDNNIWNPTIASTQPNENELIINVTNIGSNSSNVRRNLNDLLAEPPDDLQTTLEDLRDCDNDFSKFAQQLELEANDCNYDDLT